MLEAITKLLLFQLIGEGIARSLHLPIPGPVIGMLLLFILLCVQETPDEPLRQTSQTLLQHLSLLFFPAGGGIIIIIPRLREEWWQIILVLFFGTAFALGFSAWVMEKFLKILKVKN